jgi:hypothetical protein
LLVAAFGCVSAYVILTLRSPAPLVDCGGEHAPFATQKSPGQAVFVAKILYGSFEWRPSEKHVPWSIGLVRRRYWGLPWWVPRLILLGHASLKQGEEYFIDGDRSFWRLSSFFPYVDFRCGNRTRLLNEAAVEMRLLKDGPPKSGVRIIGRVKRRLGPGNWQAVSGVSVQIVGPTGAVTTTTDDQGIYDAVGLPPGHYSIRTDPDQEAHNLLREYYERAEGELKNGEIWGRDIYID